MTIQVDRLEARIIAILKDWYPITVEELRDELNLRRDVLERTLKSLVVKGVIVLEPLTDKTYIRLIAVGSDLSVVGPKKRKPAHQRQPQKDDSIMYR